MSLVSTYPVVRRSIWNQPDIEVDFNQARRTRRPVSFIILDLFDDSECSERVNEIFAILILVVQLDNFVCSIYIDKMH